MKTHLLIFGYVAATVPAVAQEINVLEINSLQVAWANEKRAIIRGLDEHREINSIDPDATAIQLGTDTYLVTDDKTHDVFITSRRSGNFAVIWDRGDEIEESKLCSANGGHTGTDIGQLPDTNVGDHRFFIVDTDCWIAGIRHSKFLTIMQLHGTNVSRKLGATFMVNGAIERSGEIELNGDILHISDWHDLLQEGVSFDWRIQLAPTDVRDLGRFPPQAK